MQARFDRRLSYAFLCISPILMAVVGGLRALDMPGAYYSIAGVLVVAILIAAWTLGARAIGADTTERQRLAVAGGLLVAVWAVLTIIVVMGPPDQATLAENKIRYPLLLLCALAITAGLVVLREALSEAGERFYSTLGFAAIMLASPLYVIFAAVSYLEYRAAERAGAGPLPPWFVSLGALSLILLFFGAAMTYLAAAAFAAALERTRWLGRTARRVFVGASLFAALCVGIRVAEALGSAQNPMWGFKHWYSFPGFVLLIPAVPWIMPCLFGIVLLRRAGNEQE